MSLYTYIYIYMYMSTIYHEIPHDEACVQEAMVRRMEGLGMEVSP